MKKGKVLGVLVGIVAISMMAAPALLRAVPSRYVARLPESLQQLGAPRDQAPILPTVGISPVADQLLLGEETQVPEPIQPGAQAEGAALANPPATPTAVPIVSDEQSPVPIVTPSPTVEPSPTLPPSPTPMPIPTAVRLEGFSHEFQTWNNCGPATLAMTLSYFDLNLDQRQTAAVLKPDPEDRNVSPHEMVAYVENETSLAAIDRVNGDKDTVRRLVAAGVPVILEIGIEPPGEFRWLGWYGHYLLVVAYDDEAEQFWVYDSWFGTSEEPLKNAHSAGRILTYTQVDEFWPQFNRSYIAIYRPEQADVVAGIIGPDMADDVMWQNALNTVRSEASLDPENAFHWFNLGTIYNALGHYDQAAIAFDRARAIGLPWRMLWYQFGPYEAYYQVGRYEDVVLLAEVTLKDRPYFEESYYYRGLALLALGEVNRARDDLNRAVEFNPNFAPAVIALAQLES